MARRKKTRQEKIKADLRHQLPNTSLFVVRNPTEKIQEAQPTIGKISADLSVYFTRDLRKTFYLALAVLSGQLALFFFLKNHIVQLPFINY
jgi:hypothetical protein